MRIYMRKIEKALKPIIEEKNEQIAFLFRTTGIGECKN